MKDNTMLHSAGDEKAFQNAFNSLEQKLINNRYEFTYNDITKLSNIYCAYRSGFIHKLNHLTYNNWITPEQYELIYSRMSSEIGKNCLFEGITRIIRYKIPIIGRFDIFDLDTNTLWEIKATSELKPEHYIQTVIYGYSLECDLKAMDMDNQYELECKTKRFASFYTIDDDNNVNNDKLNIIRQSIKNGNSPRYKLFNVLSGEIIEIDMKLTNVPEILSILLKEQTKSTDNFINESQNIVNHYLNEVMNSRSMIERSSNIDDYILNEDF